MGKVIEVHPIAGKIVYTNPVWQWDYGCFLHLNDIDLPFSYQAEFSNTLARGTAKSYTQTTDMVEIPKSYQESGEPIYIWIVLIDEESRITEYMINVAVNPRSKSEEGEPTPEERSEMDTMLAVMNSAAEQARQNAIFSEESAATASEKEIAAQEYANRAEQAAANAGYMFFYIDENGDLIYQRTHNIQVDFRINDGDLYVEAIV